MYIPDNYDICRAYQDEQETAEARFPVCCHCDQHITEFCYFIEGDIWCEDCMTDEFRRPVENFME